jgi:hypothetical protein
MKKKDIDKKDLTIINRFCDHHSTAMRTFHIFFDIALDDDLFRKSGILFAFIANDFFVFLCHFLSPVL